MNESVNVPSDGVKINPYNDMNPYHSINVQGKNVLFNNNLVNNVYQNKNFQ